MMGDGKDQIADRISAYLDGALPPPERLKLEAEMAANPAVAAEVEALRQVDAALKRGFADMLNDPVPLRLARSIEAASAAAPMVTPTVARGWPSLGAFAAGLALIGLGAGLGAVVTRAVMPPEEVAQVQPGWLDQVAEYHAVYAAQGRHLVEVPANEQEHLETWLADQTGVPFTVPDLTASGLTFQGARLLVANGKPVAQLMYKDAAGQVVAVCFMTGGDAALAEGETVFAERQIGTFDLVSWKDRAASYVVIGPDGREDLRRIAETAAIAL
jgi:anti-sigma factor RsiW